MEEILKIFHSLPEIDAIHLPKYVNALVEHKSFHQKASGELESVTTHLTDLLNSFGTSHHGLMVLKSLLSQCSMDVLQQKGVLWVTQCTDICTRKESAESVSLAFEVLETLLRKSIEVPEISRVISNSYLAKILGTITSTPPSAVFSSFKFLETAMRFYPGSCGAMRSYLEKFILSFVDTTDESLLKQSAKCLQLLQQLRDSHSSGNKGSWGQLQLQIICSIHEIFDAIFEHTGETVHGSKNDRLKIEQLTLKTDPMNRMAQLVTRLQNLCTILGVILTEPFPAPKCIQPDKIMGIISRGLAVNCVTLSKNLIVDNLVLAALLPEIHVTLFGVLDKLIVVLKSHMLLYAKDVCNLVLQSLKWTSSGNANGFKRPYRSIRRAAYLTLQIWCRTTKSGSQSESIADDLVEEILHDITPFESEITVKVLSGSNKYLSKEARQKIQKDADDFGPHNKEIIYNDEGSKQICCAALNSLIQILLSCGCFMKPILHKMLQEYIVLLAVSIVGSLNLKTNLFDSAECRIALYGALYALIESAHYLCPPPLQYAATIFNAAHSRDNNSKVRATCGEFTRMLEKILHPQKEALGFPLDLNEIRDALQYNVEEEGAEIDAEMGDIEEHEGKVNSTNESEDQIDWTNAQFVGEVGEVVEIFEECEESFEKNEQYNEDDTMEQRDVEESFNKNSDANQLAGRPMIDDDVLALDDELEEVSDLEFEDDGDDYCDNYSGDVHNAGEEHRTRSTSSSTPSANDDEHGLLRSKQRELNRNDNHMDFRTMDDGVDEQDLHNLISNLQHDYNGSIEKPPIDH
ncbi:Proline-, glutamic acid- and leucine-rich protein 1 [Pseudolycoriella hygida]|uniref:Proline-, glutamic acid- and leucine-rich protein 1 n=1 Tax=Pseudolycoriella hygida TaxID=35572 RepID=A0A9Q0NGP9_9DIPT|nr:Proline-, glutamic acid- and leucine-rich protein 1 [Pseudolycoriella hygida]